MSFSATSYILKGKKEKRYVIADEEKRTAEHRSRLYVYDANTVDKMNKSEHQLRTFLVYK
jgi:hypothetical protein